MARLQRFSGPATRLTLLVLVTLAPALLDRGEALAGDAKAAISSQGTSGELADLGLAGPETSGEDSEDGTDDVLLHDLTFELTCASHTAPLAVASLSDRLSTERPLRPPIS